jgi:hypothetical protein
MKRILVIAVATGALAIPAASLASSGSNPTTTDAIGWCVSAGNYNYLLSGETTGQNRSELNAADPGSVAALIAGARTGFCKESQSPYPPPGQAK